MEFHLALLDLGIFCKLQFRNSSIFFKNATNLSEMNKFQDKRIFDVGQCFKLVTFAIFVVSPFFVGCLKSIPAGGTDIDSD